VRTGCAIAGHGPARKQTERLPHLAVHELFTVSKSSFVLFLRLRLRRLCSSVLLPKPSLFIKPSLSTMDYVGFVCHDGIRCTSLSRVGTRAAGMGAQEEVWGRGGSYFRD
jgi:hypothetical protein